jgi:hypothetical protein
VWYGEEEAIDDETGPDGVPRLLMSWYEPLRLKTARTGMLRRAPEQHGLSPVSWIDALR